MVTRKAEFESKSGANFCVTVIKDARMQPVCFHIEVTNGGKSIRRQVTYSEKSANRVWLDECTALNEIFENMEG